VNEKTTTIIIRDESGRDIARWTVKGDPPACFRGKGLRVFHHQLTDVESGACIYRPEHVSRKLSTGNFPPV
jgi:hypothetical protein